MGENAQILLVVSVRQLIAITLTALFLALPPSWPAHAAVVKAEDYSSFWIWGGVTSQPVLSQAKSLYILQGEVVEKVRNNTSTTKVIAQGMPVARLRKGKVWLVYRATTLHWTPGTTQAIISQLKLWQLSGNPIVGLQIDFDAKTRYLHEYVVFLKRLRASLPTDYRLGITGLLDWSATGDINALNQLHNVVDEVIVQTYQGRKTISNYHDYLPALKRLTLPFKIGLVQNGEWQAPDYVKSNPWFQGYVVFLQNQPPRLYARSASKGSPN